MQIRLEGLDEYGLDGEYELEPHPNMREMTRFRKEMGLSPSEMSDAITGGGLEVLPFYIFTALQRAGKMAEADRVLEVPFDLWAGFKLNTTVEDAADGEEDDPQDLPPLTGSGENETSNDAPDSSGSTSNPRSEPSLV